MERQNLEAIPTIINDENVLNEANRSTVDSNRSQSVSSCMLIAIKFRAVDSRGVRRAIPFHLKNLLFLSIFEILSSKIELFLLKKVGGCQTWWRAVQYSISPLIPMPKAPKGILAYLHILLRKLAA